MKIYINGRFLTQSITGVQRFAREIVKELDNQLEGMDLIVEIILPKNSNLRESYKNISIRQVGNFKGHLWEQLDLPLYTKGNLLINLCNTGPLFKRKQFVVIHDAAIYKNTGTYSNKFIMWYKILYKFITRNSIKVMTVSEFSKKEISRFTKINSEEIVVISEGREHIERIKSSNEVLEKYNLKPDNYLLAVSSMNPNKNFSCILEAIKLIPDFNVKVVIVGSENEKIFKNIGETLNSDSLLKVGNVSDECLKGLYENTLCFIFPSFYEGFGLPPLEAMTCGAPMIVSETASMPEVCGEAPLYFNPNDPTELSERIRDILSCHNIEYFKDKSLRQSKNFSWKNGVKTLINNIHEVK